VPNEPKRHFGIGVFTCQSVSFCLPVCWVCNFPQRLWQSRSSITKTDPNISHTPSGFNPRPIYLPFRM